MGLVFIVLGMAFGETGEVGEIVKVGQVGQVGKITVRIVITEDGQMIEVLTKDKLANPTLQDTTSRWTAFYDPVNKGADKGRWLHRAKRYYELKEGDEITLKTTKDGEDMYLDMVVPAFEGKIGKSIDLKTKKPCTKSEVVERRVIADVGLAIINRFRAARGLNPIQYDQRYADCSRINNERGGVHRYNIGMQTWASPADPEAAVAMWMGPYWSSHGVIIMSPNITRGGTNSRPGVGTTFTGN